jgi:class 3 adenylate cyclase
MKGKGYVDVYILTDKLQQVDVVEKAAQRRMTLKAGSIINNEIDTNKISSAYKNTFIANQRRIIANQKKSPPINQDMIAIAATPVPNNEDEIKKVDLQIDVLDSESSSVEKTPLRNKVERGTIGPGMHINVIPVDSTRNMDMNTNAQTAGKNSAGDRKLTMSPHMKPRALIKKSEPEFVELGVNTPIAPPDNPSGFGAFTKNLTAQKYIRKPEAEASSPKSRSPVHKEIASMVSEESVKSIDDQLPVQQIELALPYNPNQMLAQMKSVTGMPSEGSPSHSKQRASNMGSAISPNLPFMSPDQFLSPVVSPNRSSPLDNNNSAKGNANFSELVKLGAPGDRSPAASSKQLMNKQASSRPSQDGGLKTKVMIGKKKNVPPPPPPEPVQEAALPLQNLKTASLGSGLIAKSNSMRPRMKSTKEEGLGSRRNSLEDLDSDQEVSVNSDKDGDEFDDLNNNDKNNNHKLPTNPRILEGFGKKNKMRYSLTADFSLFIVMLDCLFAEIYAFSESRLLRTNGTFRLINYLVIVSLLFVILMKASLGKTWVYKSLIYLLFGCRLTANLLDLFTTYGIDTSVATAFQVKSITVQVMIESIFFLSSGLFYPVESLAINIFYFILILILQLIVNRTPLAAYELFELLLYLIFNITETFSHYKFEYESFISVMNANKKSIQYIKFVNRLLPRHIQQTTTFGNKGESYQDVTILFADICGFTAYSSQKASREVVEMLSKLFTEFDMECNRLNLFKLYTIGDCYVVMGFVDKRNRKSPSEEAHDVVQLGISMISIIHRVRKMIKFEQLNMRIGIHTGSKIYGGLIGTDIVRFDLYGPDLVIANKMESNGAEGHINISERTKTLLEELQTVNYTFEENKKIYIKSTDSEIKSYFVRYNE